MPRAAPRTKMLKCNLPLRPTVKEILEDFSLGVEDRNYCNRDSYIAVVKTRVAELDAIIAGWYRHECRIRGCDCGEELTKAVCVLAGHLSYIKHAFGEAIAGDYPDFMCLVTETFGPCSYEALSSRRMQ